MFLFLLREHGQDCGTIPNLLLFAALGKLHLPAVFCLFAKAEKLGGLVSLLLKPIGRKPGPSMIVIEKKFMTRVNILCRKDAHGVHTADLHNAHHAIWLLCRVVDEACDVSKALRIDNSLFVSLEEIALVESVANKATPVSLLLADPLS